MLKIQNLEAGYGKLRIIKGISLHVNHGEITAIIGANGAGKTTLLNTIAGVVKPKDGKIIFKDEETASLPMESMVMKGCSLVPEGRQLFTAMSVHENLVLGGYALHRRKEKKASEEALAMVYHLFPRLKERDSQLAGTLSGGEQQMLALGRALMARPDLITVSYTHLRAHET